MENTPPTLGILGRLEKLLRHDSDPAFGAFVTIDYDSRACRWRVEWDSHGRQIRGESDDLAVAIERAADQIEKEAARVTDS